ncbi:hypothetical protein CLONEX_02639 [[Clostridium] nexile DSM 1787]|nr:hypothetical protein CLONEX_02639 [[Clostridium] nexile DSM 1787]
MSEAQIIEFLKLNSDFFRTNDIILTAVRTVGWLLVKGFSLLLDCCITLYNYTFGLIDITRWSVLENYLSEYKPLIQAIMMASLVILGFMYMFGKNKKHNVLNSVLILAVVMSASTTIFTELNRFSIAFKDAALSGGSTVNGTKLIRTNLYDLYYIDSQIGLENLNSKGKIPQGTSLSKTDVDYINIGEVLDPGTDGLSKNAESILKKRLMSIGNGEYGLIDAKDGVAWTDFGNTYYYRYTFHYGTYYLTAAAAILIYVCLAYKNTRVIYEIFVSRILVSLYAANLSSERKVVKILESIRDSYFALCFTVISLKSYFLFVEYLNSKTEINGLARGIIILFIAWCVIDGANIIEKLTGVDAGLSSMTGKLIAAYHMIRGAGQTVQQARQFHMMKEQRDAMKNMQATSQGSGTGGSAGDSFKNMEQSMEQNGTHNQNSNSNQQMEESLKGAEGMENRQGNSFDEMSQSVENEMQSEQMNNMNEEFRMQDDSSDEMLHQNMEQEEHETDQVSGMEEKGTTENLTSAGEVTSKEPFSDQEEKPEKNNVNDMHEADQKQANGFESQQTSRKQPFAYEEPKNMFEKWENKTDSRKSSNHADVNRASTSAMRERTPMQEQRKYAENSPKRKERGKSDFPETERRKKR